jgi:N-methylhydantoinase A
MATTAEERGALVLGVDIGGTFTDLVLVDEAAGRVWVCKELTTPRDPAVAVLSGLARLAEASSRPAAGLARVIHATTLITNAIIERKGACVGLLTTRGFRDVLEIGRESKYDIYDLFLPLPAPLVPRERRHEVTERLDVDGTVLTPIDVEDVVRAGETLVAAGAEAIAVSFLHAFVNAAHERAAAAEITRRWPALAVTCSSAVAPEIREFERTSTTVANAYVLPLAGRYLGRLEQELASAGFRGRLDLMLSSGGIASVAAARETPVQLIESGPAAGALIAAFFGRLTGHEHLLALDMGGTTAKLCLVDGGQPAITYSFEAARERRFRRGSGLPIRIPSVELVEIGAGGGSIARVDALGLMKVGPDSAGAEPGPACYGRGGKDPTVTDAALVLGYLDPAFFLGGAMPLHTEAAHAVVAAVASKLGAAPVETAWAIHDIVCEQMASAARIHVAEKGKDPRRYALLATGGAAPGHACRVAAKLGLSRVICPPGAGVASTFGLLVAPPKVDRQASWVTRLDEIDWTRLESLWSAMADDAVRELEAVGVARRDVRFQRRADLRYVGQGFEIVVRLPAGPWGPDDAARLRDCFDTAYRDAYARLIPGAPVEALTWRLTALGPMPAPTFLADDEGAAVRAAERAAMPDDRAPAASRRPRGAPPPASPGLEDASEPSMVTAGGGPAAEAALKGQRRAYFPESGGFTDVDVYDRYGLLPGAEFRGPAIVEERESTVVVVPGAVARVDQHGSLIIELGGRR